MSLVERTSPQPWRVGLAGTSPHERSLSQRYFGRGGWTWESLVPGTVAVRNVASLCVVLRGGAVRRWEPSAARPVVPVPCQAAPAHHLQSSRNVAASVS